MKNLTSLIISILLTFGVKAQDVNIDSLKKVLAKYSSAKNSFSTDTLRINTLLKLGKSQAHPDSSIVWYDRALNESKRVGWDKGEAMGYLGIGRWYLYKGFYFQSTDYIFKALNIVQSKPNLEISAKCMYLLGDNYLNLKQFPKSIRLNAFKNASYL
jgi:hypothetical protein